jgi:hypothetical protein
MLKPPFLCFSPTPVPGQPSSLVNRPGSISTFQPANVQTFERQSFQSSIFGLFLEKEIQKNKPKLNPYSLHIRPILDIPPHIGPLAVKQP